MNKNRIKQKYFHFVNEIILIQKCVRGFFVRKTINDIDKLNSKIEKFILHIMIFCIKKRKVIKTEDIKPLNETIKTEKNSKIQKNGKISKNSENNKKITNTEKNLDYFAFMRIVVAMSTNLFDPNHPDSSVQKLIGYIKTIVEIN